MTENQALTIRVEHINTRVVVHSRFHAVKGRQQKPVERIVIHVVVLDFPGSTAVGALAAYISNPTVAKFQPMNINFGIIDPLDYRFKGKKRDRYLEVARRSLETVDQIASRLRERERSCV